MSNTIINQKQTCAYCSKEFLILVQEQKFYKKKDLPWPKNCPECRRKHRLSLRNENVLHKRSCAKCGKVTLSTYREDSPYIVYCKECYWESLI